MAFVLIKSRTDLPLFPVSRETRFLNLLTPFCVSDAFSFEPFVHQTRFQTVTAKVHRFVQKVRILKQKRTDKLKNQSKFIVRPLRHFKKACFGLDFDGRLVKVPALSQHFHSCVMFCF